jgi:hypothetical protein
MRSVIVEQPTPEEHDVILTPSQAAIRGMSDELSEPLHKRMSIGRPVFRYVRANSIEDVELRHFIESAEHDFYIGRLTCTLRQVDKEPFVSAAIEIALSTPDTGFPPPIAWSMEPLRLFDVVKHARTIGLSPSLTILGAGVETTATSTTEVGRKDVVVEALYEREPTPTWMLYQTDSTPLRGGYRFDLVIRVSRGNKILGVVAASAAVQRRRLGIIPYRAALSASPTLAFEVSAATAESVRIGSPGGAPSL